MEEEQGGFMRSILSKIDTSIASVTTCIIPGAQCGDIEQGDFDLGRIDDLAEKIYTRTSGGGGKKTRQAATFDDETIFSETQTLATMDTGADTGYYTGWTGATGLTGGSAASTSARSQCESTVGRMAHRANAKDCEDEDLVGDDDDTIEEGNSKGMARSSTFQTILTMNTLNSVSLIGTSGTGGLGNTVGTSKIPTLDSAVNTIAAIGIAGDSGGMRYESADMDSSVLIRQRTQSTYRSEKTEPTGSNRSSAAVRSERGSLICVGESTGIELELGKEPSNMPSTAVDIDECSVNDDEEGLDAIGSAVAKENEIQYNITYVQQNLVVEQSLDDALASRCPGGTGQEISFDVFKAGLEEYVNDGKDAQNFAADGGLMFELVEAPNELDNKKKGRVVAETMTINANVGGRRNSSEKKKLKKIVPPPPFFATPASSKMVSPPPFFASSTSSRKCEVGEKEGAGAHVQSLVDLRKSRRSTAVKKVKETTSVDLDATAETVDLDLETCVETCAEI